MIVFPIKNQSNSLKSILYKIFMQQSHYEIIKPLPIVKGEIASAFGQKGGGVQILPNVGQRVNVQWLIENGYIK